jgi:hypothetical protein
MKRRLTSTYKILAVAAVATGAAAGCSPSTQPARSVERSEPVVASAGEPDKEAGGRAVTHAPAVVGAAGVGAAGVGAADVGAAGAGAEQAEPAPLPPGPKESLDPATKTQLNTLLAELLTSDKAAAKAQLGHFRPLCDEAGYPLVGNVVRKGSPQGYQPSAFCAEVRAKQTR